MPFLETFKGSTYPNQAGGGAEWPTRNLDAYFSTTKCLIDLKPSCIFKFVRCHEVY